MASASKRAKANLHVTWHEVHVREYARSLSTGGIPEGEPGCKYPLGISDVVVLRDKSGEIVSGVDIVSGTVLSPSALGLPDLRAHGESVANDIAPNDSNGSNGQLETSKFDGSAQNSAQFDVQPNGSSAVNGAAINGSIGQLAASSGRLRVGEVIVGTVEQYDAALKKDKEERLMLLIKARSPKNFAPSAALIAQLQARGLMQMHCDAKDRHRRLLENPCIQPRIELEAEAQKLSAEYTAICKERTKNNAGCRCGLLSREALDASKRDDLVRECKLRGVLPNGSKAQLMDKLIEHSAANLGCTHRMCTLLAKLEAKLTLETARSGGSDGGAGAAEGSAAGSQPEGRADSDSAPQPPPSPSSVSNESVKSMSETREDEVNARLARLKSCLPAGSLLALPEDPRQRKAYVRAFLLQDDLQQQELAAASGIVEPKIVSSCPCEIEGIGCHYNTCACDPDACDNRHLWDPSSAVYAERLFELHRAAVHFLHSSWQVSVGREGSEEHTDDDAGSTASGTGAGASTKASPASRSKRASAASEDPNQAPKGILHLPGGMAFELPGGMPRDGPFFGADQVVWTMKVVEQLLADESSGMEVEDEEAAGTHMAMEIAALVQQENGDDEDEDGEEEDGMSVGSGGSASGSASSCDAPCNHSHSHGSAKRTRASKAKVDAEGSGSFSSASKRGRKRRGSGEEDVTSSSDAAAGSSGSGVHAGKRARKAPKQRNGQADASASGSAFEIPVHGVSALEYGLLEVIYGVEVLAALGPVGRDHTLFPVSPAQEGAGVLAVWTNVKGMPDIALQRLAFLQAKSSSEGTLSTLAWLELKARGGGLTALIDSIARGAADQDAGWLAAHLQAWYTPADGAAVLRRVLQLCQEQQGEGSAPLSLQAVAATTTSAGGKGGEKAAAGWVTPGSTVVSSAEFTAEATQLIMQQIGSSS